MANLFPKVVNNFLRESVVFLTIEIFSLQRLLETRCTIFFRVLGLDVKISQSFRLIVIFEKNRATSFKGINRRTGETLIFNAMTDVITKKICWMIF